MRYFIDVLTKKAQGEIEALIKDNKDIGFVDAYEPKERLTRSVEDIGRALRAFKKSGVDWDIFTYYLKGKGHTRAEVEALMGDVKEFFRKVGMLD